jgi:predicted TIM-barrel fold metal-dependent hydrolase
MDIVDTQVHFNQIGLLEAGLAAMAAVGVQSLLFDDFSGKYDEKNRPLPGYELPNGVFRPVCPEAENAATRHPDRFGILRRVDYRDPDLESIVKLMAAAPYVSALRVLALDEPQREAMDKGEFENLFEIASRYDLPAVVLVPGHAGLLKPYAEKFPDLRLVIDHCGAPQQRHVPAEALDPVLRLAHYRNVILKWSHAPFFFADTPYPFPDAIALLQRALGAFGPDRIMWGSDFTVTAEFASWAEKLFYVRDAAALSSSDKEWILGRTARHVLRWSAKEKTKAI